MNEFDDRSLKPLFIGPKAENSDLFEQLLIQCFRDHCYWRRNFHPEDIEWVNELDRLSPEFIARQALLRDKLNQLLAMLKRCSPTFHPRYLGHMHTDLMMGGVLGEFAALFYSQNNVVAEASPVTARLELDAVGKIAKMVGYETSGPVAAWGHLCSGGTVANIHSIWTARNVRHVPISLFLSIRNAQLERSLPNPVIEALSEFKVSYANQNRRLVDMETHELLNIPIDEIFSFRSRLVEILIEVSQTQGNQPIGKSEQDINADALRLVDQWIRNLSPAEIGDTAVDQGLLDMKREPISAFPWKIVVSTTKHYSFEKIGDLLGLGRRCLSLVSIQPDFSINVDEVRVRLETYLSAVRQDKRGALPLAMIAVVGSTEEGAVDDLPALVSLRQEMRERGLEFWLHADGAYGGYAASMLRPSQDQPEKPFTAPVYFTHLAGEDVGEKELTHVWSQTLHRIASLPQTDSVTIDPHKMGLLPYPAGTVIFRDGQARHAVSCDAPYLFDGEEIDAFPGRYTLEGSRPGHVAAGIYLAHEVLPLDQFGHGAVIGRSMLAAGELYEELPLRILAHQSEVSIHFITRPALNIVNFIVSHEDVKTVKEQNILTELILQEFSADQDPRRPIPDFEFFLVSTRLDLGKYRIAMEPLLSKMQIAVSKGEWERGDLQVFRSVVMHPHLYRSKTRVENQLTPVVEQLAERLAKTCVRALDQILQRRSTKLLEHFRRPPRIMIVEDDPAQVEMIRSILVDHVYPHEPIITTSETQALDAIRSETKANRPIDLLLADLQLEGDEGKQAWEGKGVNVIRCFQQDFNKPVIAISVFSGLTRAERERIPGNRQFDKADFGNGVELAAMIFDLLEESLNPTPLPKTGND